MFIRVFGIIDVRHRPDRTAWPPTRIHYGVIDLFRFQPAPLLYLITRYQQFRQ